MSPKILIVTRQWNNKSWGHARGKRPPEVEINGVRKQDKRHSRETHDYANFKKL